MNQHESRKVAMQAVFLANHESDLSAADVEARTSQMLDLKGLPDYSKSLIEGIITKQSELKEDISSHLKSGWRFERLNPITVAILEVALYEIKYSKEIQPKAAVDEALNLSDEFNDPKTKPFINGILANFIEK